MQSTLDGLLHDAASLRTFVQTIVQFCEEHESSQTYLDSTCDFFQYIRNFGGQTLNYIQSLTETAGRSQRWIREYRQKLVLVKKCWSLLHSFVKPAADAHTLCIPVSLVNLLEQELRTLPRLTKARIVLLLSSELNYFQHRHTRLKRLGNELQSIIPGADAFPEALGFIAIPYSQASSILTNVLIYHEAGHFASEELSSLPDISSYVAEELNLVIYESLKDVLGATFVQASDVVQSWCVRLLARWCEEIYCDLFAILLVGPAFTFAAVQLFGLMGSLGKEEDAIDFADSHPADACRFKEHVLLLKRSRWWPAMSAMPTEETVLIAELAAIPEAKYSFQSTEPDLGRMLIKAFRRIRPAIRRLVQKTVGPDRSKLKEFRRYNATIRQYLSHGVVPSTLVLRNRMHYPAPVAVINASFFFYLQGMPGLLNEVIMRQSAESIERRSELQTKLEMWTMKALDDYSLFEGQREHK